MNNCLKLKTGQTRTNPATNQEMSDVILVPIGFMSELGTGSRRALTAQVGIYGSYVDYINGLSPIFCPDGDTSFVGLQFAQFFDVALSLSNETATQVIISQICSAVASKDDYQSWEPTYIAIEE